MAVAVDVVNLRDRLQRFLGHPEVLLEMTHDRPGWTCYVRTSDEKWCRFELDYKSGVAAVEGDEKALEAIRREFLRCEPKEHVCTPMEKYGAGRVALQELMWHQRAPSWLHGMFNRFYMKRLKEEGFPVADGCFAIKTATEHRQLTEIAVQSMLDVFEELHKDRYLPDGEELEKLRLQYEAQQNEKLRQYQLEQARRAGPLAGQLQALPPRAPFVDIHRDGKVERLWGDEAIKAIEEMRQVRRFDPVIRHSSDVDPPYVVEVKGKWMLSESGPAKPCDCGAGAVKYSTHASWCSSVT